MFESGGSAGGAVDDLTLLTSTQLAERITRNHQALLAAETQVLVLACAWADLHDRDPQQAGYSPLVERARYWGGDGTPAVAEFCVAEFATLQRLSAGSGQRLIADALDLRHRLPRLWQAVCAGSVRAWQARKVAEATRTLSKDAAAKVDRAVDGFLPQLSWARFERVLEAAVLAADPQAAAERAERARTRRDVFALDSEDGLRTVIARATAGDAIWFLATVNRIADILAAQGDPDPVGGRRATAIGILAQPAKALQLLLDHQHDRDQQDPAVDEGDAEPDEAEAETGRVSLRTEPPARFDPVAARPRVVLLFHLAAEAIRAADGLVRPEHGDPMTLTQLRDFLTRTGCPVRVQPILDPGQLPPVDAYEVPPRMRDAIRARQLAEVFPYGASLGRQLDLDHTRPYLAPARGGPPGQTRIGNLGPLSRRAHRAVTHGQWARRQPDPGQYLFRSPHGYIYLVTNQGTTDLGRGNFAHRVWTAAADE